MVPPSATSNSFEKRPEHPIGSARFSAYCRGMKKTAIFQTGATAGVWATAPLQRQPNLRQRILVVDDDPLIRRLNSEVLIYSGYRVDAADDGASAWDALLVNDYDLLITDNDMPKVTGVDLLKKVHATRMAMPVVMAAGTFCQSKHYNLDDADWLETASKHNFCFQISIFQCWSSDRMGCNASNYSPWRTMLSRAFSENRRMILLLHGENTP